MYIPKQFQNNDVEQVRQFISENGFGILINHSGEKINATHIPLVLNQGGTMLHGHMSKANPQWKTLKDDKEVLAIFNGPHAYISSSWYNHENVPTWNYIAVHVHGKIRLLEGEALVRSLTQLVNKYEKHSKFPVKVENMSPDYLNRQMNGLVGFEISITRMEASYKLSQNRDRVNHEAIIEQLQQRSQGDDLRIAEEMKKYVKS